MNVQVDVELTERDVLRAHTFTLWQLPGTRAFVMVTALLAMGLVLLTIRAILRDGAILTPLVGLAAVAGLAGWVIRQVRSRARAVFTSMPEETRRGSYTFDADGFAWRLGAMEGTSSWHAVTGAHETDDHLFFVTPGARTHVLPKRGIPVDTLVAVRDITEKRGQSS